MEELPFLTLRSEDGDFDITPANSRLFTFVGRTLLENGDYSDNTKRNHVYYINYDVEPPVGVYVFGAKNVVPIGSLMLQHQFPADLNRRSVPEADEQAYQRYLTQRVEIEEVEDYIPEDWDE